MQEGQSHECHTPISVKFLKKILLGSVPTFAVPFAHVFPNQILLIIKHCAYGHPQKRINL